MRSDTINQSRYFAASNSADGFVNYFPRIFIPERCQRLFVIKGGPGTGKSCFMKQVAQAAEQHGHKITYYYCSSDPNSLDGLLIEDMKIGFIDGTAPHVWEPASVGTFEQLINLGEFWDWEKLAAHRSTIENLARSKKKSYAIAYQYLCAEGQVKRAMLKEMEAAMDEEKMRRAAGRLLDKINCRSEDRYGEEVALCDSLGMLGRVRLNSYEASAKVRYIIKDVYGSAAFFFGEMYRACKSRRIPLRVSFDPLLPECVNAVAPLGGDTVLTLGTEEGNAVNLNRFIKAEPFKRLRHSLKEKKAAADSLEEFAKQALAEVREYHFAMEQLFFEAMDFSAKESFTEAFCQKLFS